MGAAGQAGGSRWAVAVDPLVLHLQPNIAKDREALNGGSGGGKTGMQPGQPPACGCMKPPSTRSTTDPSGSSILSQPYLEMPPGIEAEAPWPANRSGCATEHLNALVYDMALTPKSLETPEKRESFILL